MSLAIGNEWGGGEELHPERTYSPTEYIERWSAYAQSVADYAFGDPDEQIWQIGSFHSPTYDCQGNLSCWTTDTLLQLGINKNNITKTVNTHQVGRFASSLRVFSPTLGKFSYHINRHLHSIWKTPGGATTSTSSF